VVEEVRPKISRRWKVWEPICWRSGRRKELEREREGEEKEERGTNESLASNDLRTPGAPPSLDDDHSLSDGPFSSRSLGGSLDVRSLDGGGGSGSSSSVSDLEVGLLSVEVTESFA